ncbi:alpha/beta fold hydrolase [Sideroxydans lithotrophicus]|uniref:Alpha/beta hydrolase fold protein n=1 Tax=Sideroxydans lithotrophicus (strain ES-1) TaxID=580332 RepID=D5CR18_SIDLE|nr:alpha/beta hydrolase [Sideroxydans lithotrophicus]ADE11404.1 alpha/beta hydrolase fold protein [Sideroxydans lithotrophicus ES-1]
MTTWVLLRGLMRETRHWGEFPMLFQDAVGARNIVTLDFPGNGSLHAHTSLNSVAEMAHHCRAQLKQLGYAPPYRVLALSLGAMVAVEWCRLYPDELERLVLINTSLAPNNPFYHRLRPANYPALSSYLMLGSAARRERLILRLTSTQNRSAQQRTELLEQWTGYARECPVTRANILRQLRAAASYRAAPAAPAAPVLLLAAQRDRLVNVKCSLTLAKQWDCTVKLHPTAGHDIPLDDGYWVAQQVKEWVKETDDIDKQAR